MKPRSSSKRLRLPLLTSHQGKRSSMTCLYRCGNACDHPVPNKSDNSYLGDLIAQAVSRRSLLRAGAVVGVGAGAAGAFGISMTAASADEDTAKGGRGPKGLDFTPVEPNTDDAVTIPEGYQQQVVIRWGDPILEGTPELEPGTADPEAAAGQFGYNCDYLSLVDVPGERHLKVLVANHEYTDEPLMFLGYDAENPTAEQVETAWAAHGLSVVVLEEDPETGELTPVVGHELNRRLTATSEFQLTGPAAGSDLVKTAADPDGTVALGTLNNCAGGTTPWGTTLHGEENFNQYFANTDLVEDETAKERLVRYGFEGTASERKWEQFDERFDVTVEPNEPNRFGYIVELDPFDPEWTPRKRTALGRFKHEGAGPQLAEDGRVIVYMGDDERFDYFYKFVSANKMKTGTGRSAREHNRELLDEGTLYVAKFTGNSADEIDGTGALPSDGQFDGTGEWIALASGDESFVDGFTAEEVYVFTRQAADAVGATKMDRPEDVEPNPENGKVYLALTNNADRGTEGKEGADEPNPRNENKHGQVLELTEESGDADSMTFGWNLLLVCGDPEDESTYFGGFPKDQVSPISCPDNVAFDPHGNLWISTDGNALGNHDGLFGVALDGDERGLTKQFLTVPIGAETCGPIVQKQHVLVAVQHPGEVDGASAEVPASQWPDGPGNMPRPSVVNVTKEGFGSIG